MAVDEEPPPLPPAEKKSELKPGGGRFAKFIANLLDSCFRIPGTKIKVGIDPLLGLIPWAGEIVSTLLGTSILFEAARAGTPLVIIGRMVVNILLNAIIGIIPFAGDAFSFWFKSNTRNYNMMQEFRNERKARWTDYLIFLVAMTVILAVLFGPFYLLYQLYNDLIFGEPKE